MTDMWSRTFPGADSQPSPTVVTGAPPRSFAEWVEVGKLVFGVALFGVAAIWFTLGRRWWDASGAAALALLLAAALLYRRSRDRADAASGPNLLLRRKARLTAVGLQGITPYLEAGEVAARVVLAGARLRRFMLVTTCRRIMLLRLGRVSTRIRGLEVSTSLYDAHWKVVVPDGSRTATLKLQVDGTRRVVYVADRWWVELDAMAADIRAQGAPSRSASAQRGDGNTWW